MTLAYRDLDSLDDLRRVTALERLVWGAGYDDLVPASLMIVQVKCGAIVIGAFDAGEMVGFVYGFPGERHGTRLQWSHMLGVLPAFRRAGTGYQLKLKQRDRAIGQGLDLVEWTFDPLQAPNAQFNIQKLGVVVSEYIQDAYGESQSELHRGAPTDRFVAQWWLHSERVTRALSAGSPGAGTDPVRFPDDARTPVLNPVDDEAGFRRCQHLAAFPDGATQVAVNIPADFTALLNRAPEIALDWRLKTRHAFQEALGRGFRVTAFVPEPGVGGRYILTKAGPDDIVAHDQLR